MNNIILRGSHSLKILVHGIHNVAYNIAWIHASFGIS